MLEKLSFKALATLSVSIGLTGSSIIIAEVYYQRTKLRNQRFYKKAMNLILNNPNWSKQIGEPLVIGGIKFWDSNKNYFQELEAKLTVPFFGTYCKGEFELYAKREDVKKDYTLTKLLMITKVEDEDKKVVLFI